MNETRGAVLGEHIIEARSWTRRLKGLLGCAGLEPGEGLLIIPCTSIHTCFMKFTIDALFFDHQHRVIEVRERLKPFRLTRIYLEAKGVLELPAGSAASTGTTVGDQLSFS